MHASNKNDIYFDSFGVVHIPKEVGKRLNRSTITNIYKIQAYGSVMCGFFFIWLIDFMFKVKILADVINLFHHIILRNDGIILNCFKNE